MVQFIHLVWTDSTRPRAHRHTRAASLACMKLSSAGVWLCFCSVFFTLIYGWMERCLTQRWAADKTICLISLELSLNHFPLKPQKCVWVPSHCAIAAQLLSPAPPVTYSIWNTSSFLTIHLFCMQRKTFSNSFQRWHEPGSSPYIHIYALSLLPRGESKTGNRKDTRSAVDTNLRFILVPRTMHGTRLMLRLGRHNPISHTFIDLFVCYWFSFLPIRQDCIFYVREYLCKQVTEALEMIWIWRVSTTVMNKRCQSWPKGYKTLIISCAG